MTVGLTYRIPSQAVLPLLYEVGRAGNFDITENFQRIVADRTAKIFAQQNTTRISENREQILNALKTLLSHDLGDLYHIEVVDFQIAAILSSESFAFQSRLRSRQRMRPLPPRIERERGI